MEGGRAVRRWWLRVTAGAVVLVAVGAWSLALQVGASSGEAFALAVPPPTIPASLVPASTEVTTAAAVDTTVAIAGAEGAGAAAAGTVCAATIACAVVAVGVIGAAYGTYSLLHWAWGSHHQAAPAPQPTTASTVNGGSGTYTVNVGNASTTLTVTAGSWSDASTSNLADGGWVYNQSTGNTSSGTCSASLPCLTHIQGLSGSVYLLLYHSTGSSQWALAIPRGGNTNAWVQYSTGDFICAQNSSWVGPGGAGGPGDCFWRYNFGPGAAPLPAHTVKTDIACLDGSGNVSSHAVSVSASFDDSSTSIPDTPATPCPNGTIPGQTTVTETTTGQPDTPLYTVPAPKLDPANPCSAVGGKCAPTLQRTDGRLWVDDPNDYPGPGLDGSYRCEWLGPSDSPDGGPLPMSDCVAAQPSPNPSPSVSPSPAPNQLDPYVPQAPPTSDGRSCFPHGIGLFNPIEWVFKPTVCALRWAFVPDSTSVQTDVSTLTDTWDQTPPGVVVTSAHRLIDPFTNAAPTGSDCAGPLVSFSIPSPFSSHPDNYSVAIHPFSMCNQIGAWVHDYFYPLMTLVLYLATFWQVARTLTSTIGLDTPFDEDGGGMASPL